MEQERKRNIRLDLIRVIAIVSVVWIHCQENGNFTLAPCGVPVDAAMYLFGRMGVPLFFMLTGALLIPREIRPLRFWLTRALPLYLVAVFWNFAYALEAMLLVQHMAPGAAFTGPVLAGAALGALRLVPGEKHLWYMLYIVAIYVLMPLLAQAKRLRTRSLVVLLCVMYAFTGVRLAAGIAHPLADLEVYAAFVLTGYLLRDRLIPAQRGDGRASGPETAASARTTARTAVPAAALTAVSAAVFLRTYLSEGFRNAFAVRGLDVWWYYSPFIMLTAVCLFAALLSAPERRERAADSLSARAAVFLSENSFGVYLVHILVIRLCFRAAFFTDTARTSIGTAALAALGTLAISCAVSAVCGKIPGIRCLFLKRSLQKS